MCQCGGEVYRTMLGGHIFLLCYYLFFPLTWKAWEPWDCSPYKVSNTTTIYTMDADPTEKCYNLSIVHIGIAWVQYQSGLGYFIPSPCLCIWLGSFTLTKKLFKKIKSDAKKGEQRDNRGVKTLLPYVCRHKYV